jgi:hypothetical protein
LQVFHAAILTLADGAQERFPSANTVSRVGHGQGFNNTRIGITMAA